METATTEGIKISVSTAYENNASAPRDNLYIFSYVIKIENLGNQEIQLLKREWNIFDSIGKHNVVKGDGVIGKQPFIAPEETYTYQSSCYLSSDMGKMSGYYHMIKTEDNHPISVLIPEFQLVVPHKLN